MATNFYAAVYILQRTGPLSAMELQKLVYYAQAWSLVWEDRPLFNEKIRAWVNGPVVPELFFAHQGEFMVASEPNGNADALVQEQKDTVDIIIEHYGSRDAKMLSHSAEQTPRRHGRTLAGRFPIVSGAMRRLRLVLWPL